MVRRDYAFAIGQVIVRMNSDVRQTPPLRTTRLRERALVVTYLVIWWTIRLEECQAKDGHRVDHGSRATRSVVKRKE